MSKDILKKEDISDIINFYFIENNLIKTIYSKTGYAYSIDYLISYTTFKIPSVELDKEIYANQWHLDKPFSKDTLKIIIPTNFHDYYNGGLKIFNFHQTQKIKKNLSTTDIEKSFETKNQINEILLFHPNLCFHKAGNPKAQMVESRLCYNSILLQMVRSTQIYIKNNLKLSLNFHSLIICLIKKTNIR